jgi:hypothetical protein
MMQSCRGPGAYGSRKRTAALDVAFARVDREATRARHRDTGDGCRVAPPRLSVVLDLEAPPTHRSTDRGGRRPRADSHDGAGEPAMGRAPRIRGELLKRGIDVCQATVAKYMIR